MNNYVDMLKLAKQFENRIKFAGEAEDAEHDAEMAVYKKERFNEFVRTVKEFYAYLKSMETSHTYENFANNDMDPLWGTEEMLRRFIEYLDSINP